jgi:hypothetical protein
MPSNKPASLKNVRNCQHIKVTGIPCGGPAMRGEQFCYFHQRRLRGVKTPPNARLHPIALIEDEESIQASLMEVINALARNHIDLRRADLILKALYIASKNSHRARLHAYGPKMVRAVPDYPAPPKTAAPPIPKEQAVTQRAAENAALQVQARTLATIVPPAITAPAPVLVASTNATTRTAVNNQKIPNEAAKADPTQRKPQARAGLPATTKQAAVNQSRTRT